MKPPRIVPFSCLLITLAFVGLPLVTSAMMQPRIINVPAGGDIQTAINSANCGDRIVLQAGAVWDGQQVFNKTCGSNPITLTTSGLLNQRRVTLADAAQMPRLRALGGDANAAIKLAAGSSGLTIDGIDFVDNAGTKTVNAHIAGLERADDITIQRCLFGQKETGTNYNRSVMRAVWIEGARIKMKWNYVHLIGYYYPEAIGGTQNYQMDTTAFLSVGGPGPITIEDNYINVWWNGFFLGGGDTGAQNTATLTNASLTSATFSNMTGITPGLVLRFTRGTVYETATVASISGNLVNYTATGPDALKGIPQSAAWNYGDQGLINDVSVIRNTFEVDPAFARDVFAKKGYAPKGAFEIKNVNRFLYEGNRNIGYAACWAITPRNQNGSAPWATTSNMLLKNNWVWPTEGVSDSGGRMAVLSLQDELHTTTPAVNIQIVNNFARNVANMIQMKGGDGWNVRHNTVINDAGVQNAYHVAVVLEGLPATRFEFVDNVIGYSNYGMSCSIDGKLSTCWPGGLWKNNVVVDFANAGFNSAAWGAGGILEPIPTTFPMSPELMAPYKGKGSDGKDPGVDLVQLLAALAGASVPTPSPTPTPTATPTPTPSPTPLPTPSPTPQQLTADFPWPSTTAAQRALREQTRQNGWRCAMPPYNGRLWCEKP